MTLDLLSQLSPIELLLLQWTNNLLRYFLIAGLTYMVFWKWFFEKFKDRFLYKTMPERTEFLREIKYSVLTTLLFIMPTALIVLTKPFGFSKLYFHISDYSVLWFVLSFFVVFFLHDTYFYWTHRLMHTKRLYPTFIKFIISQKILVRWQLLLFIRWKHLLNLLSKKTRDSFPLNLLHHSTHHSWHHRFYKGNYGFYLKFWDRVMGTYGGELK